MMKHCAVVLLGLCLLAGCATSHKQDGEFAETLELAGRRWNANDDLGRAYDLDVRGNCMFLRNDWGETKLTFINLSDKGRMYNFGVRGEAPDELANPGPLLPHTRSVDVFDGSKMSLLRYDVDSIMAGSSSAAEVLFRTGLPGIISMVSLPNSDRYVASGIFPKGRLCLLDGKGAERAYFGRYPSEEDLTGVPFHVLGMAYQSLMCAQPTGNRTAMVTRYGEILQIHEWDLSKEAATEVCCMNKFSPRLTVKELDGTPNFRPNEETRWGYLSVAATDKYVFALYSGRLQQEGNAFHLGNEVHVFDWDGKPCYLLRLDCEGSSVAVNEKHLFILAEYGEGGNDIVEYDLSLE